MKTLTLIALAASTFASFGHADEFRPALEDYLNANVMEIATDPMIIAALKDANAMTSGYDAAKINDMDQAWRAEVGNSSTPTITPVLNNPTADVLRRHVDASDGVISELFIMDSVGLNVAASAVTSDMWQGEEAKFTETYGVGAGATHISDVEFDESAQAYLGQISIAITDPETGELLGAMTVGVNAEALF